MKNRSPKLFTKIITTVVLVNFCILNLASAQAIPPTTTNEGPSITRATFIAAQSNEAACLKFKEDIWNASSKNFKATWISATSSVITTYLEGFLFNNPYLINPSLEGCYIVIGSATEGIEGVTQRSEAPKLLERNIYNLEPDQKITANQFTDAITQAKNDQNEAGPLSKLIGWVLNALLSVVAALLGVIASLLGMILSVAIDQTTNQSYKNVRIVNVGWGIVRDFANMFFIIILIVIALGAILRIESLDYRHLLGELVIMAILINFSKVIAMTIIDFANLIGQIFWVDNLRQIWAFIYNVVEWESFATLPYGGWSTALVNGLSKIIFMLVAIAAFGALTGLFIVRLVGLYVFIIFSPAYFVLDILPATKEFAHKFLHKFVEYVIWVPVALFMMRLTMMIAEQGSGFGSGDESAFTFIILAAFLWATVLIAEHAGMVGGQAIVNGMEKAVHGASHYGLEAGDRWLAKGAAREGGGGWNRARRGLSYFSYGAWKAGAQARSHHKEEEAYTVAAGKRADLLNKVISREDSDFALKARNQRISSEMKNIPMKDKDEKTARAAEYFHHGEIDKALGYTMSLASQGDLNEVLLALKDKKTGEGYTANAEGLQKMFEQYVVPQIGKDNAYRLGAEISKAAEEAGHWNFAGAFTRNSETGEYQVNPDQDRYVTIQRSKPNVQNVIRTTGRLGAGFVEQEVEVDAVDEQGNAIKKKEWVNVGIDDHGINYIESIQGRQLNEWRNNGNKNLKANIVVNNSQKILDANPDVWASAAEDFVQYINDDGTLKETLTSMVAKPLDATGTRVDYTTTKTIKREQAIEYFTKYYKGTTKELSENLAKLYEFAGKPPTPLARAEEKSSSSTSTPTASTPPPPPPAAPTPPPPTPGPTILGADGRPL